MEGGADGQDNPAGVHRCLRADPGDGRRHPEAAQEEADSDPDEREGEQSGIPVPGTAFPRPGYGAHVWGGPPAENGGKTPGGKKGPGGGSQAPGGGMDVDDPDADAADHPVKNLSGIILGGGSGSDGKEGNGGQCKDGI